MNMYIYLIHIFTNVFNICDIRWMGLPYLAMVDQLSYHKSAISLYQLYQLQIHFLWLNPYNCALFKPMLLDDAWWD